LRLSLAAPAASGFTAKRFVAEGAYVFITGRRQTELDAAVNEIGKTLLAFSDVSSGRPRSALRHDRTKARSLDVVFANAGVGQPIPLGSITEEHFKFNTNVRSTFSLCRRHRHCYHHP